MIQAQLQFRSFVIVPSTWNVLPSNIYMAHSFIISKVILFLTTLDKIAKVTAHPGFPSGSEGKDLPAMWETWVRSLGWEDPLEKEMAIHSSILAWRIPWMEEPGGPQSKGSQRIGHNWATSLSLSLLTLLPLPILICLVVFLHSTYHYLTFFIGAYLSVRNQSLRLECKLHKDTDFVSFTALLFQHQGQCLMQYR